MEWHIKAERTWYNQRAVGMEAYFFIHWFHISVIWIKRSPMHFRFSNINSSCAMKWGYSNYSICYLINPTNGLLPNSILLLPVDTCFLLIMEYNVYDIFLLWENILHFRHEWQWPLGDKKKQVMWVSWLYSVTRLAGSTWLHESKANKTWTGVCNKERKSLLLIEEVAHF